MPHNARTLMLVPVGAGVGMTSVSLGLIRALERNRVEVQFFKPVAEPSPNGTTERTTEILRHNANLASPSPFSAQYAETRVSTGKMPELLEEILARYRSGSRHTDVIVVEGILPSSNSQFSNQLNYQIAKTLDAEVVLVACPPGGATKQLKERLEFAVRAFGEGDSNRVVGCIINKLGAPFHYSDTPGAHAGMTAQVETPAESATSITKEALYQQVPLRIVGCIPWNADLLAPRALDLARHFDAQIINHGELETRRLRNVTFCSRSLANMLRRFTPGAMLVTSADRPDVVAGACLAVMNGVKIGCLLLTGGYQLNRELFKICTPAMETGLPILLVGANTWRTVMDLQTFNQRTPADDRERVNRVQDFFASHLDENWVHSLSQVSSRPRRMSPSAFRYHLTELARRSLKRIALPEGEEPRTIKAALTCSERGIAQTILLGNAKTIQRAAEQQGLKLCDKVQIINPAEVRDRYVEPMVTCAGKRAWPR